MNKIEDSLLVADEVRNLFEATSGMPLSETIKDLNQILGNKIKWALCGRPRGTDDVDIVFQSDSKLDYIYNITAPLFRRVSDHILVHKRTGVEVDLVTPEYIKIDPNIINEVLKNININNTLNVPVVPKEGLVAMKLCRGEYRDLSDIESILRTSGKVDLSKYQLTLKQLDLYRHLESKVI